MNLADGDAVAFMVIASGWGSEGLDSNPSTSGNSRPQAATKFTKKEYP